MSNDDILARCKYNRSVGCDTIDLHIDRPTEEEAAELYPGGPTGNVLSHVRGAWVVNFKIDDVEKALGQ
jgi:hypothetical protein